MSLLRRGFSAVVLLTLSLATILVRGSERVVFEGSSDFYDGIFVVDSGDLRALRFDSLKGKRQTLIRLGHPEQLPMPYLRSAAVALPVPGNLRRMLIVGLGGGAFASFVRERLPGVRIDAVEIDPVIADLARDFFFLVEDEQLQVHVEDGVEFVAETSQRYDYILLDAYDADEIPEALATAAFFRSVRERLTPDGVAVANLSIRSDRKAGMMIRRMARQFGHCIHLRSPPHYNDVILLAQKPLPDVDALRDAARRFEAAGRAPLELEASAATARSCAA